jgi:hypothetical protein
MLRQLLNISGVKEVHDKWSGYVYYELKTGIVYLRFHIDMCNRISGRLRVGNSEVLSWHDVPEANHNSIVRDIHNKLEELSAQLKSISLGIASSDK